MIISHQNGFIIKLNENNFTAIISRSLNVHNNLLIPQSIYFKNNEYQIIEIESNAFEGAIISSLRFKKNSKIKNISKNAFNCSSIRSIQFPSSLSNLEEGWCAGTSNLIDITISPSNKYFSIINDQLLIDFKNLKEKISFACRNIESAIIPSSTIRIGNYSFSDCKRLQSVTFTSQVIEEIGESSFSSCSNLREISLPSSVTKIEKEAFAFCGQLEAVNFADDSKLKSISKGAFRGTSLKKLSLPDGLENLEEGWCCGTDKLVEINLTKKNKNFILIDKSFLIQTKRNEKDKNLIDLILIFARRDIESVTLSSKIKKIAESSFEGCVQLNSIEFESHSELEEINDSAFKRCICLQSINKFPSSVKRIGKSAFSKCQSLESIFLDENSQLRSIGKNAFKSTKIRELHLPPLLDHLEEGWCNEIYRLTVLTVSDQNKNFSIRDEKFLVHLNKDGSSLAWAKRDVKDAVIPADVRRICNSAFKGCSRLISVTFLADSKLTEIGDFAFGGCSRLEAVSSIPESVKMIGRHCFILARKLESVELLGGELQIGKSCFEYCSKLSLVSCPNAKKLVVSWRGFYGASSNFSLFVIRECELTCEP